MAKSRFDGVMRPCSSDGRGINACIYLCSSHQPLVSAEGELNGTILNRLIINGSAFMLWRSKRPSYWPLEEAKTLLLGACMWLAKETQPFIVAHESWQ